MCLSVRPEPLKQERNVLVAERSFGAVPSRKGIFQFAMAMMAFGRKYNGMRGERNREKDGSIGGKIRIDGRRVVVVGGETRAVRRGERLI